MNTDLLKKLGNIDQIAGIRESVITGGRGEGTRIAEFYNAAGLRFTVVPDKGMDIYDLSYKGVNLSFHSKNGLTSPNTLSMGESEFSAQWSAGAMVTCGLGNVGGYCETDSAYPTHGRIGFTPAENFGTEKCWQGNDLILSAKGEMTESRLFGRCLKLNRTVTTGINGKTVKVCDRITNCTDTDEPYMLLYHCNFGYPLLDNCSKFVHSKANMTSLVDGFNNPENMSDPITGAGEELYLYNLADKKAYAGVINRELGLGAYLAFNTETLPNLLQWKRMKTHDYVLGIEPCNTCGMNREEAINSGKIAVLPAYSYVDTEVELGVLDGEDEINAFLSMIR